MRRLLLYLLLLCSSMGWAQRPAEAGIVSDNDLYTSVHNDRYYTNGLELFYRFLSNSDTLSASRKIWEFRLGQYMYNPQSVYTAEPITQDRPYAGYLFAQGGINIYHANGNLLKANLQLGVVGPESGAEATQKFLHGLLHYPRVLGWKYQIRTTPAVQLNAFYSHKLFSGNRLRKADYYVQAEALWGTIWSSASVGVMSRISLNGMLTPINHSSMYGAALNQSRNYSGRRELFVFFNPRIQYMYYDATIQGSPFNNSSPVTYTLIPFRFNAEAGIKYGRGRYTYAYSFNYRGQELRNNVITGYYYGSIQLGYLF